MLVVAPDRLQEKEVSRILQLGLGSRVSALRVFSRKVKSSPALQAPALETCCILVAAKV